MKRFIYSHKRMHRGFLNAFAALTVFLLIAQTICNTWRSTVDAAFGVETGTINLSSDKKDYQYLSSYDTAADAAAAEKELAIKLQEEGSVLLKGSPSTLQVAGDKKVTLFGMRSYMAQYGGSIGSTVSKAETIRLDQALEESGFSVNPQMVKFYQGLVNTYAPGHADGGNCTDEEKGYLINEVPQSEYTAEATGDFSGYKDAAILVLGRDAGESSCMYPGERGTMTNATTGENEFSESTSGNVLGLSDDERDLLHYVEKQGFDKVIVLLNSVNTMEVQEIEDDAAVDAMMWIGTPGCFGFLGVANLLSGQAIPSGHLADTYAVDTAKSAAAQNYGIYTFSNEADIDSTYNSNMELRSNWYLVETEGIYIGYKYYETRYYDTVRNQGNASTAAHNETANGSRTWNYDDEVTYPFGYGIEGSTFSEELIDSEIDWTGDTESTVLVKVTNTGDTAAKHVVELFVQSPYTDYDKENGVEKSAIQLVGYGKTGDETDSYLKPGDSEEVRITFNVRDFASYDKNFTHDDTSGAYRLEAGNYYFASGNGSHDAVKNVIVAQDASLREDAGPMMTESGFVFTNTLNEDVNITKSVDGGMVGNHFDEADLNQMNCGTEVTYLTRNDWADTFPTAVTGVTATEEMIYQLRNATADLEAADAAAGDVDTTFGTAETKAYELKGLDYDDPLWEELISSTDLDNLLDVCMGQWTINEGTIMPRMYPSDSPLGFITAYGARNAHGIYYLEEDDEGYGYQDNIYCSPVVVASSFSHEMAKQMGNQVGEDGIWSGITCWYGPGLNIHRTPYNGRNIEYYSEDSILTGIMASDVVTAYQSKGGIATVKHFAFNDQEANRDGIAVFFEEQGGRENELRGFQLALEGENGAKSIMTGFNRIGCTFSSANVDFITGLVRDEWNYNGYVITDSTKSGKYMDGVECLLAGTDMMLGGYTHYGAGKDWPEFDANEVLNHPALVKALRESYHRYAYLSLNSTSGDGLTKDSRSGSMPVWEICLWLSIAVSGFLALISLIFYILASKQMQDKGGAR